MILRRLWCPDYICPRPIRMVPVGGDLGLWGGSCGAACLPHSPEGSCKGEPFGGRATASLGGPPSPESLQGHGAHNMESPRWASSPAFRAQGSWGAPLEEEGFKFVSLWFAGFFSLVNSLFDFSGNGEGGKTGSCKY